MADVTDVSDVSDVIQSRDRVGQRYNGQPIVCYHGYAPVYSWFAGLLTLAWSVELESGGTVTVYDYVIVRAPEAPDACSAWSCACWHAKRPVILRWQATLFGETGRQPNREAQAVLPTDPVQGLCERLGL